MIVVCKPLGCSMRPIIPLLPRFDSKFLLRSLFAVVFRPLNLLNCPSSVRVHDIDHLVFSVPQTLWLLIGFWTEILISILLFGWLFIFLIFLVFTHFLSDSLLRIFVRNFTKLLAIVIFNYILNLMCIDSNFGDFVGPTALVATVVNNCWVFVRFAVRLRLFTVLYRVKRRFYDFSSEKGKMSNPDYLPAPPYLFQNKENLVFSFAKNKIKKKREKTFLKAD